MRNVSSWSKLDQGQSVESNQVSDEGLATARAEIAAVVYQRVAGHASVADHLEALLVGEGLGATSEVGEINLFLP